MRSPISLILNNYMFGPGIGLYKSMKEVSIFKALKKLFIKDTVPDELVKKLNNAKLLSEKDD